MQVLTFSKSLFTIVPTVVNWAHVKDVYETNTATRIRLTVFYVDVFSFVDHLNCRKIHNPR